MRVPLSWLRDYIDVDLEPQRLAEQLTMLGMEVKGIERRGTDWTNVVVGELLAVITTDALERGLAGIGKSLDRFVAKDRLAAADAPTNGSAAARASSPPRPTARSRDRWRTARRSNTAAVPRR